MVVQSVAVVCVPKNLHFEYCEGARTYVRDLEAIASLFSSNNIDAIEIHTGIGCPAPCPNCPIEM